MSPKDEKRKSSPLRRDLNELVRDPDQKVSEAKLWANAGKAVALYLTLAYSQAVIERWDVLTVLLLILVAPDLLKKLLAMRYGAAPSPKG